jgi:nitroimidazol reductase NimA-like FMN-containing flavoprotein (pyridoxamine 5'-phosphate oxidase superfamily)
VEATELATDACWKLLEGAALGRVALVRAGLPTIVPVNICAAHGAVWVRTGPGALLDAALASEVLSVEADEIDRQWHTGWSVLVTGRAEVAADRADLPVSAWARADANHLVKIEAELVTGRRI